MPTTPLNPDDTAAKSAHTHLVSPPAPRFTHQLVWFLRIFTGLLLLSLSVWVFMLRADQQQVRRIVAGSLWGQVDSVATSLEDAQRAAADGDSRGTINHLVLVQERLRVAARDAAVYEQAFMNDHAFALDGVLDRYSLLANQLATTIEEHETLLPADQKALTTLQDDMHLLLTIFPEEMLATAPYPVLVQGLTDFCHRMQNRDMTGMQHRSGPACMMR